MITFINNNAKLAQNNVPLKHVITDPSETVKLLEKECGYQKPWSLDERPINTDKNKGIPEKAYKKIDFFL